MLLSTYSQTIRGQLTYKRCVNCWWVLQLLFMSRKTNYDGKQVSNRYMYTKI